MEWKDIRAAYKAARQERGLRQDQVGDMAQGMISKLETNNNLGPTVGIFVRAIEGLGMSVSQFFAQIEGLPEPVRLGDDHGLPTKESATDEAVPAITAQNPYYKIGKAFATIIQQSQSSRGADRRFATKTSDREAGDGVHPRSPREGSPQRRIKSRPPKR
jgi:transcriptional regulator with XRE-family HTH domain